MRRALRAAVILAVATVMAKAAFAQTLTADLSSHIIGITTGFAGANLVLFGTTDRPGDIAVLVRGPSTDMVVRRKQKVLGVWVNGSSAVFGDAPSFYAMAATKPLNEIAAQDVLARRDMGLENIRLQPREPVAEPALTAFRNAFLHNEEDSGLYRTDIAHVTFLGEHLFRADMTFPANVPTGNYSVEILLFSGGQVVSAQTTPLIVSRIGFSNGVFMAAQRHAALYGAGALTFALAAGWAAASIFRRV